MSDQVMARAVRPFEIDGRIVTPQSRAFPVSRHQFASLSRNRLVVEDSEVVPVEGVKSRPLLVAGQAEPSSASQAAPASQAPTASASDDGAKPKRRGRPRKNAE